MTKLTLDVNALAVESFGTLATPGDVRGTVAAREATPLCNLTELDCQTNIVFCPSRVVTQCNCTGAI